MLVVNGLDKMELNGLNITHIDYTKLKNNSNVITKSEGKTVFKSDRKISYLKITNDELFTNLVWGVKVEGNSYIEYCIISLKVCELGENNLFPYNVEYYRDRIIKIIAKLERVYGLTMQGNFDIKTLEYNATIFLDRPLKEYEKCLLKLEQIVPKRLKSVVYRGKQKDIEIVYVKNNSRSYKFYNKSKQLEEVHNIKCQKEVLRIEYAMHTKEQIQKELGSSNIEHWTNEQLKEMFKKNFEKDFIIPYEKKEKEINNWLVKEGKKIRKTKKSGWILQLITNAYADEKLFDIDQVEKAVKEIDKHNFSKNKKTIENNITKNYRNKEQMQELFNFVMGC